MIVTRIQGPRLSETKKVKTTPDDTQEANLCEELNACTFESPMGFYSTKGTNTLGTPTAELLISFPVASNNDMLVNKAFVALIDTGA